MKNTIPQGMYLLLIVESEMFQRVTNHPVHLLDRDGNLLPTALILIPLCEFVGDLSIMGIKHDQFDVPICNSFRPKMIKDQLCYTVDLNKESSKNML